MKLDGGLNINPNNLILKNICEVFCKFLWVNNFHVAVGGFR